MSVESLDLLPVWMFPIGVGLLLLLSQEIGYEIGRWRHARWSDEKEQPVGAMVGSVLGLLALILAFTFSLAASRFEDRRIVVLDEANAVGTTFLRAQLLPAPLSTKISDLLKKYAEIRVVDPSKLAIDEVIRQSEQMHIELWNLAHEASAQDPRSIPTGLFIQSLNEMIDLHSKRILVGIRSRVPVTIWLALSGLAVLGLSAMGYQAGLSNTRRSPAMVGLVLSFTVIMLLIGDLDRGQDGLLRVSQHALIDVQKMMSTYESSDSANPLP